MKRKKQIWQKTKIASSYFLSVLAYATAMGVGLYILTLILIFAPAPYPYSNTVSLVAFFGAELIAILGAAIIGLIRHRNFSNRQKQRRQKEIAENNPYIVGAPVPPDRFYGREELIDAILASITAGNHIAIYGERRIGKTSLLHQLEHKLAIQNDITFIPIFIQMQMLSEDIFFGVLIDSVVKSMPTSAKKSLPPLIRPNASQSYDVLDLQEDLESIIETLTSKNKKPLRLIFLLDEGDRLNEFSEATQMQLRGLLQTPLMNKHVQLAWSGAYIDQVWKSNTSPWFNLFKANFHLDSLKPQDARDLIIKPVNNIYYYDEEAVDKILTLTNRKPYLIQQLCSNCIEHIQSQGSKRDLITPQDVETIWKKIKQRDTTSKPLAYQTTTPQTQIAETPTPYNSDGDNS